MRVAKFSSKIFNKILSTRLIKINIPYSCLYIMSENYSKKLGKLGEKIAYQYLQKLGYQILYKNFCIRGGEIDLITRHQHQLVFFEIKTRRVCQSKNFPKSKSLSTFSAVKFGQAEEQISWRQQITLLRTANIFLYSHNFTDRPWQFDLISINLVLSYNSIPVAKLTHLKNIFVE